MWASIYFTASPTVAIFSASSSGISTPNSSSRAMTSSTTSSESAPRSSTNEDSGETSSTATPSCSTTMFLTRSKTDAIEPPTPVPVYRTVDIIPQLTQKIRQSESFGEPEPRQRMTNPPSTFKTCPVMYDASSEARQTTAAATPV